MYYFHNHFNVNKPNKYNLKSRNKAKIKERDGIFNPKRYHIKLYIMLFSNSSLIQPQRYVETAFLLLLNKNSTFSQAYSSIRGSSIFSLLQTPAKAEFHLEFTLGRNQWDSSTRDAGVGSGLGFCLRHHQSLLRVAQL